MTTNEEIQVGRAKNTVLTFLENRLIVPKIYLDADWGGQKVDLLAIERDGVGDVHAVLLFQCEYDENNLRREEASYARAIDDLLDRFSLIPANYKYIGVIGSLHQVPAFIGATALNPASRYLVPDDLFLRSFSPDGIGRVGMLAVDDLPGDEPTVRLDMKPERFRAKIAKLADEYVQQHEADWEIRA